MVPWKLRWSPLRLTQKDLFQPQGCNPHYHTAGDEGDIPNVYQHSFYQWVYSGDAGIKFPDLQETLGRCLGPAKGEGNEMLHPAT
jgi:hypothetical protein